MRHFVYLLLSLKKNKIKSYVGYTNNLKKRLKLHNTGKGAKSTRGYKMKIIYFRKYNSKKEAMTEEFFLKKNRKRRKKIIFKYLSTSLL